MFKVFSEWQHAQWFPLKDPGGDFLIPLASSGIFPEDTLWLISEGDFRLYADDDSGGRNLTSFVPTAPNVQPLPYHEHIGPHIAAGSQLHENMMYAHNPLKRPKPGPIRPGRLDPTNEEQNKEWEDWKEALKKPDEAWSKFMQIRLGDDLAHVRDSGKKEEHGTTYQPTDELQAIVACCNKATRQWGKDIVWLTYNGMLHKNAKTLQGFKWAPNQGYGVANSSILVAYTTKAFRWMANHFDDAQAGLFFIAVSPPLHAVEE